MEPAALDIHPLAFLLPSLAILLVSVGAATVLAVCTAKRGHQYKLRDIPA